jgi:Predicted hydrolases of the HAD superfamily
MYEGDFMGYKLITIDMDDTLLTSAKEISEKNQSHDSKSHDQWN